MLSGWLGVVPSRSRICDGADPARGVAVKNADKGYRIGT